VSSGCASTAPRCVIDSWDVNVEYQVGTFRLALHEAWQAQATGLWGASGSGKSTFLEILLGLRRGGALRGHVKLNGRVLFDSTAKIAVPVAARDFAWAPQDQALFPHLTVAENILFAYSPARPPGGRAGL